MKMGKYSFAVALWMQKPSLLSNRVTACDFTLCLAARNLPNFEAWSGPLRGLVDIGVAADSCDLP
jgi:hypothetical protein